MAEKLVIQLLEETVGDEIGEESETSREFRWGFVDDLSSWPEDAHIGTGDDLLLALEHTSKPATLLIPGDKVVSFPVAYNKKEARHFLKLLPYQIEDDVVGDVEDLHFAVSNEKDGEVVSAAYVDFDWICSLLDWFKDNGLIIESCIADFQCLNAVENELLLWFSDGSVLGHRSSGLGFSISQSLSQPFLKDLLQNQQDIENPWQVRVYVNDSETKEIIESHIMPPVEYEVAIGQPPLDFEQSNQLNFCSGKYGKKLPIDEWWKQAKPLAMLSAAAIAIIFLATFADIYLIKQRQASVQQEIVSAFRTAVPNGPVNDPVSRLKRMLGSNNNVGKSSQAVYLLAKVAPVLDKLKIGLATLNYSNREQALRINIKAASFNGVEQFRQQLGQQGINAELQSSNAAGEGFQARLRITSKGGQSG